MMLVTPSLLSSFQYYFSSEFEDTETDEGVITTAKQKEQAAHEDFLRTLRRERGEPSAAMLKGIAFEDRIRKYCGDGDTSESAVREVGDIVRGGMWQEKMKKELDGFLLYAIADVIKQDTIYDIKYTGSYEVGKYSGSAQHRIEFLCTGMPSFAYLVSNERDVWREDYSNHAGIEGEVRQMIADFTGYLKNDLQAHEIYYKKWKSLAN